ncbi:MAG: M23 family metallopeptidase [Cyclobacteriaceae bacterium]
MIRLSNSETEKILEALSSSVGNSAKVKHELFDHWCCFVEAAMSNGSSFEQAFEQLKVHFDIEEVKAIEENYLAYHPGTPWMTTLQRVGSMAAMLIFLVVAGVDAQKRPDISPVFDQYPISSGFGDRIHPIAKEVQHHNGIDLRVPMNTPIRTTADGTVVKTETHPNGHGLHIIISHTGGYETLYANLSRASVSVGQTIVKGEIIGESGNSGLSTAPHLHYEIRHNKKPVNPEVYISK